MRAEARIEAACVRVARARGLPIFKLAWGATGWPDRIVLLPGGRCLLVELKTEVGVLSPRQRLVHRELAAAGHPVAVVRSSAEFKTLLDQKLQVDT